MFIPSNESDEEPWLYKERPMHTPEEIATSMRYALKEMQNLSIAGWSREIGFSKERKVTILQNMIEWFAHEDREEYETAAWLKKGLDQIQDEWEAIAPSYGS